MEALALALELNVRLLDVVDQRLLRFATELTVLHQLSLDLSSPLQEITSRSGRLRTRANRRRKCGVSSSVSLCPRGVIHDPFSMVYFVRHPVRRFVSRHGAPLNADERDMLLSTSYFLTPYCRVHWSEGMDTIIMKQHNLQSSTSSLDDSWKSAASAVCKKLKQTTSAPSENFPRYKYNALHLVNSLSVWLRWHTVLSKSYLKSSATDYKPILSRRSTEALSAHWDDSADELLWQTIQSGNFSFGKSLWCKCAELLPFHTIISIVSRFQRTLKFRRDGHQRWRRQELLLLSWIMANFNLDTDAAFAYYTTVVLQCGEEPKPHSTFVNKAERLRDEKVKPSTIGPSEWIGVAILLSSGVFGGEPVVAILCRTLLHNQMSHADLRHRLAWIPSVGKLMHDRKRHRPDCALQEGVFMEAVHLAERDVTGS